MRRHPSLAALPGLALLGLLATFRLGNREAWLDEAASMAATRQLWESLTNTNGTMAAYYVQLTAWAQVDDTITWFRLLSVVHACLALLLLGLLANRLGGPRTTLWAGLFMSTSWLLVRYAQEARAFAFVVLVVTLSWCAFERIATEGPSPGPVVLLLLAGGLAPLSHGLALFAMFGQLVVLLAVRSPRRTWAAVVPAFVLGVGVTAWLYQLGASEYGTPPTPNDWGTVGLVLKPVFGSSGGGTSWMSYGWPLLVLLAGWGVVVSLRRWRRAETSAERVRSLLAPTWAATALGGILLLNLVRPGIHSRYAIGAVPSIALLHAVAGIDLQDRLRAAAPTSRTLLRVPVIPLMALAIALVGQVQLHRTADRPITRTALLVATEAEPGDGVYVPGPGRMPFDAAWATLDDPPAVVSVGHLHPVGEVMRYDERTSEADLGVSALDRPRLWLVDRRDDADEVDETEDFLSRPLIAHGFTVVRQEENSAYTVTLLVHTTG